MTLDVNELLRQKLEAKEADHAQAMSLASVAAYVQNQNDMIRSGHRHEAQSDAILKAHYADCGHPEVYDPPTVDEDDMPATLINCTINGDKSMQSMMSALTNVAQSEAATPETPETPETPPPPAPAKKPWWAKAIAPLLAVGLGAGIALTAANYFAGDEKSYDMVALPYVPGEVDE